MLKKFCIKNYKNFEKELVIDFQDISGYQFGTDCITDGLISKMLIYGRNATGKTNLGKALMDIKRILLFYLESTSQGLFLNADSAEEKADFVYEFAFGDSTLIYQYSPVSDRELKKEKLIIDGRCIFELDFGGNKFAFENLKYIGAETANVDRYVQMVIMGNDTGLHEPSLPFLRWLINNVALNADSILIKLIDYARKMTMIHTGDGLSRSVGRSNEVFYEMLEESARLNDLEEFLNEMGVECQLELKKLPDGQHELYFRHKRLVPFSQNASSGTAALVDLYRRLIPMGEEPSFLYLDEFDAFYHYEMSEKVIRFLKGKFPQSQVIVTTHNTNLMTNRLMRPDCLFILSGGGALTALCNATCRELREGHNLEKMYISGEFERYE